jgi:membrane protein YqaA with SNARE-associated domain
MPAIKKTLTRKAAKSAAKHTAHGTASKFKRNPIRAVTLLSLGGAVGALAGWMIGRSATGTAPAGTGA